MCTQAQNLKQLSFILTHLSSFTILSSFSTPHHTSTTETVRPLSYTLSHLSSPFLSTIHRLSSCSHTHIPDRQTTKLRPSFFLL